MGARTLPDGALLVPMRAGPTYLAPLVNLQIIRARQSRRIREALSSRRAQGRDYVPERRVPGE
jgi:hypothetical protein